MLRYFPTRDKDWLLARLREVEDDEADGMAAIATAAGDVNTTNTVQHSCSERKRRILWDLVQVDPQGEWSNHITPRVTRHITI